jgi:hypothetical protein
MASKARNPKHEIRNKSQGSNEEMAETADRRFGHFLF